MKRALVSVSDKSGLIEFLKPLVQQGLKIVSTGGTLKYLQENGISAEDVSHVTGFPEVLDGRVKTLHPFIHMGLLADKNNPSHLAQATQHQVQLFDLVVGNLYPFEQAALNTKSTEIELIEKIDIGGPSFLRSAAKNYQSVAVVSDPNDYDWVQQKILSHRLDTADRKKLALKVFSLTSYYDALIVQRLSDSQAETAYYNIPLKKKAELRYGENAHQHASWYENPLQAENLATAKIHQGKELSYNNILDLEAAIGLVKLIQEPACVAVKHNNPCAAAFAKTLSEAVQKVIDSDPKSIFGGILAFNQNVDLDCCERFKNIFLECLIAPSYSAEALEFLKSKKNLRVLSWPQIQQGPSQNQLKSVMGGVLVQNGDSFNNENWVTHGQDLTAGIRQSMKFGEKVCAFLKSNAVAIVCNGQTVGLGMGQVNRVDAVQQAIERFREFKSRFDISLSEVILISDAFFPFPDSIELIAKEKIKWILQPGGSVKDNDVIAAAKSHEISMTLSAQRHFRH